MGLDEMNLNRPVREIRRAAVFHTRGNKSLDLGGRTTGSRKGFLRILFLQVHFHRLFVEILCFALHNPECIIGTITHTGAQSIAVFFRHNAGFSVHHLYGAFGTGGHAFTATIAAFLIYLDYLTHDFHRPSPLPISTVFFQPVFGHYPSGMIFSGCGPIVPCRRVFPFVLLPGW